VCVHLVDTGQFNFISAYLRRRQLSRTAAATAACGDESRWDGTWRSVPDVVPYGRAGPGGDHDVIIMMSGGDVTAADRPSVRSSLAGACASAAVVDTTPDDTGDRSFVRRHIRLVQLLESVKRK